MFQGSDLSKAFVIAVCGAGALFGVSVAKAGPYSAEYVFGDSLSDNGNVAALLHLEDPLLYPPNFPNPPSYDDSFTNGPVAVARLAGALGLSLNPSLWTTGSTGPGTNYAVGGATAALAATGGPTGINLPEQVGAYSAYAAGVANPNALYVIMIGGNDVRNAALQATGTAAVQAGVNAELAAISALSAEDARNFLIVNVPNVGVIPEFAQDNPTLATDATTYSIDYDNDLNAGLASLDPTLPSGTSLNEFDLFAFNTGLLANAANYGFTNTTDRCYTNTPYLATTSSACGAGAANINSLVYWDSVHPTGRVQALWAQAFGEELGVVVGVPEPSTWSMMLVGFAGLGYAGYRARRKVAVAA